VIILSAAALMFLPVFMSKLHSLTIQLSHHRLIDCWDGFVLLGCVTLLTALALGSTWRYLPWLAWLAAWTALGVVIHDTTDSRQIVEGRSEVAGAIYAEQGIGLIVAGLAALMILSGGLMNRPWKRDDPLSPPVA
jgi:hypothetical protein